MCLLDGEKKTKKKHGNKLVIFIWVSKWLSYNTKSTMYQLFQREQVIFWWDVSAIPERTSCILMRCISYSRENKLYFDEMMMMSVLYYTNIKSWNFISLAHWNKSAGGICHSTQTHYPDIELTSLCSYTLVLCA